METAQTELAYDRDKNITIVCIVALLWYYNPGGYMVGHGLLSYLTELHRIKFISITV